MIRSVLSVLRRRAAEARLKRHPRIEVQGRLKVIGRPDIWVGPEALIVLGDNVRLDSGSRTYHVNMHSPCKLLADRSGARISLGPNTRIHGTCIHACREITIGRNCLIAANTQIFDGSGHDLSFEDPGNRVHTTGSADPICIEDNVWIGCNVIVLPGVHIGTGSVVGAGSVVTSDIPPYALAAGNPAKILRQYPEPGGG